MNKAALPDFNAADNDITNNEKVRLYHITEP